VLRLVHEGLKRAQINQPPEIARIIDAEAAALVHHNVAVAAETLRLQQLFDEPNLPVLFVKGASLAMLAFGNLGLRCAQDIDLLVPWKSMAAATALVARAGYSRFDPPPGITDSRLQLLMPLRKDLGFIHQATNIRIELHWRLFLNSHAMAEDSLMAASRLVLLTGARGVRTLGEEDLFAYLCMHGAVHTWNRLQWLADLNALLAGASEDDIERLVRAAELRGAGRAAAQAMLLCHRIFSTPLSSPLVARLAKPAAVRWLEATALGAIAANRGESDPHDVRFGTTRGSLSTFLLRPGWRYWIAELKTHLINQTDVLTVPLPRRVWLLYAVLRLPLWVWRHWKPAGLRVSGNE
jgi:hypothetical protein